MKQKRRIHRIASEELESKKIGVFATVYAVILLLLLTVLQTTVFPSFKLWGVSFDVLLTAALLLSVYTNEYAGAVFGLVMGAVSDAVYEHPLPVMPIVFLVLCSGAGLYFHRMQKGNLLAKFAAIAVALAARSLILTVISLVALPVEAPFLYIWKTVLPEYIFSFAVSPVMVLLCLPVRVGNKKRL